MRYFLSVRTAAKHRGYYFQKMHIEVVQFEPASKFL